MICYSTHTGDKYHIRGYRSNNLAFCGAELNTDDWAPLMALSPDDICWKCVEHFFAYIESMEAR